MLVLLHSQSLVLSRMHSHSCSLALHVTSLHTHAFLQTVVDAKALVDTHSLQALSTSLLALPFHLSLLPPVQDDVASSKLGAYSSPQEAASHH